jgi:hypothetical protein
MTFFYIMGSVILAGLWITIRFFRKGGPYNPVIKDFTDLEYLPEPFKPDLSVSVPQTPDIAPPTTNSTPEPAQPARIEGNARLTVFCEAIRDFEGKPGDLNYQLNNPGDCRPSPVGYLPKYEPVEIIDTDTDPRYPYHIGKFAKFPTYELGWEYLQAMVHMMATNHPNWTLIDFFNHFAPASDGSNDPNQYAKFVANRLSVIPTTTFKQLFV